MSSLISPRGYQEMRKGAAMAQETIKKAPSLSEYAYEEIKHAIERGVYPPGAKLITQEIADRLNAEGYADAVPQHGIFVKKLSVKMIRDTLELRLMIELFSVDAVIRNMVFDSDAVQELRSAVEGYQDIGPRDYDKAMKNEANFHSIIIRLAQNAEILRVYQSSRCIETTYQMYRMANMELATVQNAYQEHVRIVELLEAGNQAGVKALLEKHIQLPLNMLNWLVNTGRTTGTISP